MLCYSAPACEWVDVYMLRYLISAQCSKSDVVLRSLADCEGGGLSSVLRIFVVPISVCYV